ncbi:DUF2243 domain-containing protein [Chromohalobacter sp.]|jgi:uncharacterized membrane protein|uniref:DUF2243 domain-containing protein n=1 Tax=Chromohalobacter sp. TaxID=50740 RepID=UPI001D6070A8|nr:DUF2243 domain-containing protein [Chromohalobacter sp.]NQY45518.1 DUF2243 domain-containing protein [Chromohalobacter sp.]
MSSLPYPSHADPRRTLLASALIGIGCMAAVDEIIFHQLLAWHHFVDRDTAFALASDGVLHAIELVLLVVGFFMMIELHGAGRQAPGYRGPGFLLGAGGFQVFDGVVDHKILRLHQVRYVDDLWRYDIAWIGFGVVVLAIGWLLLRRARRGHATSQH